MSKKEDVRRQRRPAICIEANQSLMRQAAALAGLSEVSDAASDAWHVLWTVEALNPQRCLWVRRHQTVSYAPGISAVTNKALMTSNLARMRTKFPEDYDFFPRSWRLSSELLDMQAFIREQKVSCLIVKPDGGSQGRGVYLTRNPSELATISHVVAQVYISRPLLWGGFKFDLRIYALLSSVEPLRLFVYSEGIVRFATTPYNPPAASNLHDVFMHLTNYSINKHSHRFVPGQSKRHLSEMLEWLRQEKRDVDALVAQIDDLVVKTVLAAAHPLQRDYRTSFPRHPQGCFVLLGFDVLLDQQLKPHLLEVNRCPSLNTDSELDAELKLQLLVDMLTLLNPAGLLEVQRNERRRRNCRDEASAKDTAKELEAAQRARVEWEESHLGRFRRVFPAPEGSTAAAKYEKFLAHVEVCSVEKDTVASRARHAATQRLLNPDAESTPLTSEPPPKTEATRPAVRGRLMPLDSFQPCWISLAEERDRLIEMDRRDEQVRRLGMRAAVIEAMRKNNLLRHGDLDTPMRDVSSIPVVNIQPLVDVFSHFQI